MHDDLLRVFTQKAYLYSTEDQKKICAAAYYADRLHGDQKRKSGEPYIIHPLAVGSILIQLGMDRDTICAGLLHDVVEDTECTLEDLERDFGKEVAIIRRWKEDITGRRARAIWDGIESNGVIIVSL